MTVWVGKDNFNTYILLDIIVQLIYVIISDKFSYLCPNKTTIWPKYSYKSSTSIFTNPFKLKLTYSWKNWKINEREFSNQQTAKNDKQDNSKFIEKLCVPFYISLTKFKKTKKLFNMLTSTITTLSTSSASVTPLSISPLTPSSLILMTQHQIYQPHLQPYLQSHLHPHLQYHLQLHLQFQLQFIIHWIVFNLNSIKSINTITNYIIIPNNSTWTIDTWQRFGC